MTDPTFEQIEAYRFAVRTLIGNTNLVQGPGADGVGNAALIPAAVERYNEAHPDAPLPMPELALSNFKDLTGFDWVPGNQPPVLVPGEAGNLKYAWV